HNHHNDGITAVHVKTSGLDEQAMLIEADPDVYYRPPYLGPSGWVGIRLDLDEVDWDRVADRIAYSWELVAPARLLEMGGR
ncbi:MAG: MmcQ/YjbR family DNA-binding protein, partial [Sphingosinicella sp.]